MLGWLGREGEMRLPWAQGHLVQVLTDLGPHAQTQLEVAALRYSSQHGTYRKTAVTREPTAARLPTSHRMPHSGFRYIAKGLLARGGPDHGQIL